ncbi:MAG: glycerophosphodiester phosphodiesterase [Chloroflexi bacterium]|nr:glycerophosphodiester phosphodiesterase [Chloroflexota bacterium]
MKTSDRVSVWNIAHRGASSLAPENTLAAGRKAFAVGADMWEVDVVLSRDGELLIFHDDTLERTTNAAERFPERAPWPLAAFSADELRTLDAGSWYVDRDPFGEIARGHVSPEEQRAYRGEPIPSLLQVLALTRSHHWLVNLELKSVARPEDADALVPAVLRWIDLMGMAPYVLLSSFVHEWVHQVRELNPRLAIAALIDEGEEVDWDTLAFPVYNLPLSLATRDRIRELHRAGRRVNVWAVNEENTMRELIAWGVDGIFTDYPQRLRRIVREGS